MASTDTQSPDRKFYIPLENNPAVFSSLARSLNLDSSLQFYDVYSIDDPDLLAIIPRPVHALLFTCPSNVFKKARMDEFEKMPLYDKAGAAEPVMWFRQTIRNACGLMAFLHGVANGAAKNLIDPGSSFAKLLQQAQPLRPEKRAELIYNSKELETAHMTAAVLGDTQAPTATSHVGNHYICFTKGDDGHIWELNGGMKGPLDRGELTADNDMLSQRALDLSIRDFMKHASDSDVDFSLVAMASVLN